MVTSTSRNPSIYWIDTAQTLDYLYPIEQGTVMGTLAKWGKVTIRVNGNDHPPPHFHAITPDADALVTIDPLAIYRGSLPVEVWATVEEWARANRPRLIAEWNAWNPNCPLK